LSYPFQGVARFLVACVGLPAVTMALVLAVAAIGLIEAEGTDLGVQLKTAGAVLLVSGVLVAIPCVVLAGYWLRAVREVAHGATELPAWDERLSLLGDGLAASAVVAVLGIGPFALWFWGLLAASGALAVEKARMVAVVTEFTGTLTGVGFIFALLSLGLVVPVLLPMALLRLAVQRTVSAALSPGGILGDIGRSPLNYFLVLAVVWLGHAGVSAVLGWLPFLWLPVTVWFQLFAAHLLGQYQALSSGSG